MRKDRILKKLAVCLFVSCVLLMSIFSPGISALADNGTVNLALGKTVALAISGGGTDNDPQGATHVGGDTYTVAEVEQESIGRLTDGEKRADSGSVFESGWVSGIWNDTSGTRSNYVQFYRNISRELDIDLGQMSNISTLSMSFGICTAYGISAPVSVSYYISQDGISYYLAGTVASADAIPETVSSTGSTPMSHVYFRLDNLNYNAQYVKICFDVSVWLFSDELEIMGTDEAAADANPLPTEPYLAEPVVNEYASAEQSGGITDEALAYAGWYRPDSSSTAVSTTVKTVSELLSTIAYVDENGAPTDWLFNSVTFLNHGYDNQGRYTTYRNDNNNASEYTDKEGWEAYLDYIFDYTSTDGTPYNLDALDAAVSNAKEVLGDDDYTVGVKIALMPPVQAQSDWGQLVDGVGESLDFTVEGAGSEAAALANRTAAISWYISEVISRFEAKGYENITLDGFYYYDEVIRLSSDSLAAQTIQAATNAVHTATYDGEQGLYIYWIPYYQAEGFTKWQSFGFDYAIMQPNYAFSDTASTTRIADCAALAKKYGLGVEMEFGGLSDNYIAKFKEYLTQGADDVLGYQNNSLVAWYTGTWTLYQTSTGMSGSRYIYDAIYQFLQGEPVTFDNGSGNAALGKTAVITYDGTLLPAYESTYTINIANASVLTNDTYGTDATADYVRFNANYFQNRSVTYSATVDLEQSCNLDSLSAVFYQRLAWGVNAPPQVTFSVSSDGTTWTEVGTVLYGNAAVTGITTTGTSPSNRLIYTLTPEESVTARYIRATFTHNGTQGTWMYADELEAYGVAN